MLPIGQGRCCDGAQAVEELRGGEMRPKPGVDGIAASTNGWTHEKMMVLQGSKN
jgi:hypothetical protein